MEIPIFLTAPVPMITGSPMPLMRQWFSDPYGLLAGLGQDGLESLLAAFSASPAGLMLLIFLIGAGGIAYRQRHRDGAEAGRRSPRAPMRRAAQPVFTDSV